MKKHLIFRKYLITILLILTAKTLYGQNTYMYLNLISSSLEFQDSSNGPYTIKIASEGASFSYNYELKKGDNIYHKSHFYIQSSNRDDFNKPNKKTEFSKSIEGGRFGWESYHLKLDRLASNLVGSYELTVRDSKSLVDKDFNEKFPDPIKFKGNYKISEFHGIITREENSFRHTGMLFEKENYFHHRTLINITSGGTFYNSIRTGGANFTFKNDGSVRLGITSGNNFSYEHGNLIGTYSIVDQHFRLPEISTDEGGLSVDIESSVDNKVWKKESTIKIKEDSEIKFFRLKINK